MKSATWPARSRSSRRTAWKTSVCVQHRVDRRRGPRYAVTLSARREDAPNAPACHVIDLRLGGAAVEGWADASVGAVTILRIDGLEPALRARVVHSAGGRGHLRFDALVRDALVREGALRPAA